MQVADQYIGFFYEKRSAFEILGIELESMSRAKSKKAFIQAGCFIQIIPGGDMGPFWLIFFCICESSIKTVKTEEWVVEIILITRPGA